MSWPPFSRDAPKERDPHPKTPLQRSIHKTSCPLSAIHNIIVALRVAVVKTRGSFFHWGAIAARKKL